MIRPMQVDTYYATAELINAGRNIISTEGKIVDENGKVYAFASATLMIIRNNKILKLLFMELFLVLQSCSFHKNLNDQSRNLTLPSLNLKAAHASHPQCFHAYTAIKEPKAAPPKYKVI